MTGRGHQFQWRCAAQSGPLPHLTPRQSAAPGRSGTDRLPIACSRSPEQGISADRCLGSTTSRSKPHHDRSAVRREADTMNQTVRSRFTPPERDSFKPAPLRASSNSLNYHASHNRTKAGVVRLLQRKWAERGEKRPEVKLSSRPSGSDNLPGMAAFCGIPAANQGRKKNVPSGQTGGGRGTVVKPSPLQNQ
jgi:hypothetical protein